MWVLSRILAVILEQTGQGTINICTVREYSACLCCFPQLGVVFPNEPVSPSSTHCNGHEITNKVDEKWLERYTTCDVLKPS